jgi:hypothetical protein
MNKRLLEILEIIQEDFEMLKDGRWEFSMNDTDSVDCSLELVEEAIKIVTNE